ncbi:MAG TPA: dienelactone hydrolase family protein [Acidimicrobiales bacterium]|nr:dienelactone hydrolase family protein [Acidimicrobiales bacterium]
MTTVCNHGNYLVERVTFASSRLQLAGALHVPDGVPGPLPAVVILGPFAYVKEHAPLQYATRLADEGYLALAFDCSHHGESAGEPRRLEEPLRKVADVRAAIDYLAGRPDVDAERVVGLGIGEGAAEMLRASVDDERVRAVVAISGVYRDRENDVERAGGDDLRGGRIGFADAELRLAARLERARAATARFRDVDEVDYLPVVDPKRDDVALPGRDAWDWYNGRSGRGLWENRYAVMGDVAYLEFESLSAARDLRAPLLMVHGEHSYGPSSARRHFDAATRVPKQLLSDAGTVHYDYFDDPSTIDRTVAGVAQWLRGHA